MLQVKIIDFGIAADISKASAARGGSSFYVAPEIVSTLPQTRKQIGERSDIYSLGATMYELATGSPPFLPAFFSQKEKNWNFYWREYMRLPREARFAFEADMIKERQCARPDVSRVAYPELARRIILRCLEPSPEGRYRQCYQLLRDLRQAIAELGWMDVVTSPFSGRF
jgi:serine/threonine-protein kinase